MSDEDKGLRLATAYQKLLNAADKALKNLAKEAKPVVSEAIQKGQEALSEAGEWTREELEHVGDYLIKDLHSAAEYVAEGELELGDWLRLDLLYAEDKLLETFSGMVDHTKLELDHIAQLAKTFGEWHTGEIAGMGTLECKSCGQLVHFNEPGHIPPCPKCHGTKYKRP